MKMNVMAMSFQRYFVNIYFVHQGELVRGVRNCYKEKQDMQNRMQALLQQDADMLVLYKKEPNFTGANSNENTVTCCTTAV